MLCFERHVEHLLARQKNHVSEVCSLFFHFLTHSEKGSMTKKKKCNKGKKELISFFIEFEDYTALNYICLKKSQPMMILVRKSAIF